MASNENRLFEAFWDFVRRSELDIKSNEHVGCTTPREEGDFWDEGFAAAYEAIKPFLHQLRKKHVFFPPPGMLWRAVPISTDTAHQALMWFLNPPQDVYGHPGLLDSPEYRVIKAAAMEEGRLRAEARVEATKKPKASKPSTKQKLLYLRQFLLAYLDQHGAKALTVDQISEALTQQFGDGWSSPSVSRAINLFHNLPIAMNAHARATKPS